jgi:hypothetical protein
MAHRLLLLSLCATALAACAAPPPEKPAATSPFETRWLRGVSATELRTIAQERGLTCQGPAMEGGISAWTCATETPLVQYKVKFYGKAPLKIEFITATITQSGIAKADYVAPLFVALGGIHFEAGDAPKQRQWVMDAIGKPGDTTFGPAKFKVSGDLGRITLDIRASASDW